MDFFKLPNNIRAPKSWRRARGEPWSQTTEPTPKPCNTSLFPTNPTQCHLSQFAWRMHRRQRCQVPMWPGRSGGVGPWSQVKAKPWAAAVSGPGPPPCLPPATSSWPAAKPRHRCHRVQRRTGLRRGGSCQGVKSKELVQNRCGSLPY